ncbi:MAG: hypothetical protein WA021_00665 [Minisyncoccia bacterium]
MRLRRLAALAAVFALCGSVVVHAQVAREWPHSHFDELAKKRGTNGRADQHSIEEAKKSARVVCAIGGFVGFASPAVGRAMCLPADLAELGEALEDANAPSTRKHSRPLPKMVAAKAYNGVTKKTMTVLIDERITLAIKHGNLDVKNLNVAVNHAVAKGISDGEFDSLLEDRVAEIVAKSKKIDAAILGRMAQLDSEINKRKPSAANPPAANERQDADPKGNMKSAPLAPGNANTNYVIQALFTDDDAAQPKLMTLQAETKSPAAATGHQDATSQREMKTPARSSERGVTRKDECIFCGLR